MWQSTSNNILNLQWLLNLQVVNEDQNVSPGKFSFSELIRKKVNCFVIVCWRLVQQGALRLWKTGCVKFLHTEQHCSSCVCFAETLLLTASNTNITCSITSSPSGNKGCFGLDDVVRYEWKPSMCTFLKACSRTTLSDLNKSLRHIIHLLPCFCWLMWYF